MGSSKPESLGGAEARGAPPGAAEALDFASPLR